MSILRYLLRALRHPAPTTPQVGVLRRLLLKPRIFDLVSCAMQLRDLPRLAAIRVETPGDTYYARVHDYNAGVTEWKVVTMTRRAEVLYRILSVPPRDLGREKLLIVGPRNVHELIMAWLYGYAWDNIQAIDLYSTNPKICVMNMESMTYPSDVFDAVVMSNTLAYAKDTEKALTEIRRVLKPGGHLVFGATYDPGDQRWRGSGYSGERILGILRDLGMDLYFYDPTDKVNSLSRLQTSHVFGCVKRDLTHPGFDRIRW